MGFAKGLQPHSTWEVDVCWVSLLSTPSVGDGVRKLQLSPTHLVVCKPLEGGEILAWGQDERSGILGEPSALHELLACMNW